MTARRQRNRRPAGAIHSTGDAAAVRSDLVALVADKDIEGALSGLLARGPALGLRSLDYQIFKHPNRDSGCFKTAQDFLRSQSNRFNHALVLFDRHGCGRDADARAALEKDVEQRLEANGWEGRSAAVVLDPELEIWVWSPSPLVDEALGWAGRQPTLREALAHAGLLAPGAAKPADPKRAVEHALEVARRPRSSAIYATLARTLPIADCRDPALGKLLERLRAWFPASA